MEVLPETDLDGGLFEFVERCVERDVRVVMIVFEIPFEFSLLVFIVASHI